MADMKPIQEVMVLFRENIKESLAACFAKLVPITRKINGIPLSSDINLTLNDIGSGELNDELSNAQNQIEQMNEQITELNSQIDNLNEQFADMREEMKNIVKFEWDASTQTLNIINNNK